MEPCRASWRLSFWHGEHLIVGHGWFELQEKIPVFRIILGFLELRTREHLNGLPGFPKSQREKVGLLALNSSQDIHAPIPFFTLIVGDRSLLEKYQVVVRPSHHGRAMPNSCYHTYSF